MSKASRPVNEQQRLTALRRYDLLDTPTEPAFDRMTELAAVLFKVPVSLITLVDFDRIWFKSHYGVMLTEIERDAGLCASAIFSNEVYHVASAATDPRTQSNPLVTGSFGLRFYAAAPLRTHDGFNLGTLCVIDTKPRPLSIDEALYLKNLAAVIMDMLEFRLMARRRTQAGPPTYASSERDEDRMEELEKLNRLKDEFLSTVSHELRTPLSNMWVAIQLLKKTDSDQKRHQYLEIIASECSREIDLINRLLDLQQLEARVRPLNLQLIVLSDWLPPVLAPFHLRTREYGHHFEVQLDPHIPSLVSDSGALKFIVTELLNNACKYTPPGESIRLQVRTATVEGYPGLELTVTNTGVEIPPLELSRIFDKFYRTPTADPWQQQGMGLGLALLKQWVVRLGGSVSVISLDREVTFSIYLPNDAGLTDPSP